jgi:cbb3-type cytochrome oxidase subunit 3
MSRMGLATYAEVALILFLAAFVAVVIRVLSRRHAETWNRARYLPLEDDEAHAARLGGKAGGGEQR